MVSMHVSSINRRRIADAVDRLDRASREGLPPAVFLAQTDEFQKTVHRVLASVYPDGYAKPLSLKIANLFVARYHYHERHTILASSPVQLMLDPSNSCQVHCPGCVHTSNPKIKDKYDRPDGMLSTETFERFIRLYGPFAFGVVFYNYGEPFLNKGHPSLSAVQRNFSCIPACRPTSRCRTLTLNPWFARGSTVSLHPLTGRRRRYTARTAAGER